MSREVPVDEMLEPQYVEAYRNQHHDIWFTLVRIHRSLAIMDRLENFPFIQFVDFNAIAFWQLVEDNFGDVLILNCHRLINDSAGENLSLLRFKNCILQWLKPAFKEWYRGRLREARIDPRINDIRAKLDLLRDRFVAHRLWPSTAAEPGQPPAISRKELGELVEKLKGLFRLVSLSGEYCIDHPPADVDSVLNLIAKHSHFVNQPESEGPIWQQLRQFKDPDELEEMNRWRRKFGLPEA